MRNCGGKSPSAASCCRFTHAALLGAREFLPPPLSRDNHAVAFRRHLIDLLSHEPRSVSWLARELGMRRGDVEEDLSHALRSARAAGHHIDVIPARCKACDFVFAADKLTKPGRCPSCKGTRLFEPMIRVARNNAQ